MAGLNEAQSSRMRKPSPTVDQQHIAGKPTPNTISTILLSHFGSSSSSPSSSFASDAAPSNHGKKKSTSFRGFGCAAGVAEKVLVPAVRSPGEWEERKRMKKKEEAVAASNIVSKHRKITTGGGTERIGGSFVNGESSNSNSLTGKAQDVWFPGDTVVRPVEKDCIISQRVVSGSRPKKDSNNDSFTSDERVRERERSRHLERERETERSYCYSRRSINPDAVTFWESDYPFGAESELPGSRYYRHLRQPSADELAEVVMLHGGFMVGALLDRFSDWRLDIDEMSYEQLLELSDKIGYVSTGLKEDEISHFMRKMKVSFSSMKEKKCIICQDEFEHLDDLGKLECGHGFHVKCLKQWLGHKKCCPVCKTELEIH